MGLSSIIWRNRTYTYRAASNLIPNIVADDRIINTYGANAYYNSNSSAITTSGMIGYGSDRVITASQSCNQCLAFTTLSCRTASVTQCKHLSYHVYHVRQRYWQNT